MSLIVELTNGFKVSLDVFDTVTKSLEEVHNECSEAVNWLRVLIFKESLGAVYGEDSYHVLKDEIKHVLLKYSLVKQHPVQLDTFRIVNNTVQEILYDQLINMNKKDACTMTDE